MASEDCDTGTPQTPPYQDKEVMQQLHDQGSTYAEIAEMFDCGESTVSFWMKKHGITLDVDPSDYDIPEEEPWKDGRLVEDLYINERLSTLDIAVLFDCSSATLNTWLKKHGIKRRNISEAQSLRSSGNPYAATLSLDSDGYMRWTPGVHYISVHRLMAVAEWGIEAVKGHQVHHKNELRWDNRIDNLELVTNSDHQKLHRRIKGLDRLRIAEIYENGDVGSRKVADAIDYEISSATVLEIHNQFYGDGEL